MSPTLIRARPPRDTCPPHTRRRHELGASALRATIDLHPRTVEQIAQRVAQLLRQDQLTTLANPAHQDTSLLTVKELARHFKLNPAWVYEHAQELGAIRTGNGPKARMRFNLHTATQALQQHHQPATPPSPARPRSSRLGPYRSDAPVLQPRDPYARAVRAFFARAHCRRLAVS
jgi:hypothetical protein